MNGKNYTSWKNTINIVLIVEDLKFLLKMHREMFLMHMRNGKGKWEDIEVGRIEHFDSLDRQHMPKPNWVDLTFFRIFCIYEHIIYIYQKKLMTYFYIGGILSEKCTK